MGPPNTATYCVCIKIILVEEDKLGKELVIRLWMWQHGKELALRPNVKLQKVMKTMLRC